MPSAMWPARRVVARTAAWLAAAAAASLVISTQAIGTGAQSAAAGPAGEPQARAVCGSCHTFPPPDILPRAAWYDAFVRMMYIRENRAPPVDPPRPGARIELPSDMEQALKFYTARAPERLPAPEPWPDPRTAPIRFERRPLSMKQAPGTPA